MKVNQSLVSFSLATYTLAVFIQFSSLIDLLCAPSQDMDLLFYFIFSYHLINSFFFLNLNLNFCSPNFNFHLKPLHWPFLIVLWPSLWVIILGSTWTECIVITSFLDGHFLQVSLGLGCLRAHLLVLSTLFCFSHRDFNLKFVVSHWMILQMIDVILLVCSFHVVMDFIILIFFFD